MQTENKKVDRKVYLDILRIFAIFLVLFAHTGTMGNKLYTTTENSMLRIMYLYFECFRTINNSLLFMISGALLLKKEERLGTLWKKRVLRFIAVLVISTYMQAILQCYQEHSFLSFSAINVFRQMLVKPIKSSYWYLYTYIAFLIVLPFLRSVAQRMDHKIAVYLFVISIVTQDLFSIAYYLGVGPINISLFTNLIYILYPLLGYYIDSHYEELRKRYKYILQVLTVISILGLSLAVYFSIQTYRGTGNWSESYIILFDMVRAVWVFCIFKEIIGSLTRKKSISDKGIWLLEKISGATFGIYLTENILESITIHVYRTFDKHMPSILACLFYLIATMALGTIIINLLKKIPILKKLL